MVATMAEPKRREEGKKPKLSTLNVYPEMRAMIGKIANHRGLTMHDLFQEKDVSTFFKHLLVAELEKEGQRLKGRN